ncbi:MAG: ubiquinone/menaquinone biosynthesis methyltransferase [Pyrinomonadaceae bacterium]
MAASGGQKLSSTLANPSASVLDVACGTGDLALTLAAAGPARVTGIDFCRPMLEIAAQKNQARAFRVPFIEGDALRLPFADASFDAVTIAFGLRNLADVNQGLRELARVLKPGGQAAILEFSKPIVPGFSALFGFYFDRLLPSIGGIISGSPQAYQYLPASVKRFPDQQTLAEMMRRAGFHQVEYQNLTGGVWSIHFGRMKAEG